MSFSGLPQFHNRRFVMSEWIVNVRGASSRFLTRCQRAQFRLLLVCLFAICVRNEPYRFMVTIRLSFKYDSMAIASSSSFFMVCMCMWECGLACVYDHAMRVAHFCEWCRG